MNRLRIFFLAEGGPRTQSTVHRVVFMAEHLRSLGHDVTVHFGKEGAVLGRRYNRTKIGSIWRTLSARPKPDVLIIHRVGDPLTELLVRFSRSAGIRVIYDLDDAVYLRLNALTLSVGYMIEAANAVTASSHAIAEYCSKLNANVFIVPSSVDTRLFRPPARRKRDGSPPVIGWLGDGRVHAANLRILAEPLTILSKKDGFRLKLVSALGSREVREMFAPLRGRVHVDFGPNDWVGISEIPGLISNFDISVMPLLDTEFNRGKAGQKLVESMAMGIPVIASEVGENKYIVSHGEDGFLASTVEEWVESFRTLLHDPDLREKLGLRGCAKIDRRYSMSECGRLLEKVIEGTMTRS